ncbi:MAG: GNAT family N-acetyltransferase [Novipirellula sp. JB048]
MNTSATKVRPARSDDRDRILAVHLDAFSNAEGPVIVSLLEEMLDDSTAEPVHSFVAESANEIVAHVLFTSVTIHANSQTDDRVSAQILAPLAVTGERQGRGIGTQLVEAALQRLAETGVQLVFVLGYPKYYTRFGFLPAGVRGFQAPYPISEPNADAWMVLELAANAVESFEGTVQSCEALSDRKYWSE